MTKSRPKTEDSPAVAVTPAPRTRKPATKPRAATAKAATAVSRAKPRTAGTAPKARKVSTKTRATVTPAEKKLAKPAKKAGGKAALRRTKAAKTPGALEVARAALEDMKAVDLREFDVRSLTPFMDTLLICTGTSNRHVQSLARAVVEKSKEKGFQPRGVEGMSEGEWVLVDLDSVVVHVMQAQARAFYQLEKLWDVSLAPKHHDDVA